jgi:hypothetical protein
MTEKGMWLKKLALAVYKSFAPAAGIVHAAPPPEPEKPPEKTKDPAPKP